MFARTAPWILVLFTSAVFAENRFYIEPTTLDSLSADAQQIVVLGDNDEIVLGYSVGVQVDAALLSIQDYVQAGTVAADADFFDGGIVEESGEFGIGCVFDTDGDFATQRLDVGTAHVLAIMDVVVSQQVDQATTATFGEARIHGQLNPPVRNVMTNSEGRSIKAGAATPALRLTLENGDITLRTGAPTISNCGGQGRPGDRFTVEGTNFDEAGFQLSMCGTVADTTVNGNGTSVEVVVPAECPVGPADVDIETARGSDSASGCYVIDPPPPDPVPEITSIEGGNGNEGTEFTINGTNFDEADFSISVCGQDASFEAPTAGGTRVVVTAPACASEGPASVEVCNVFGCDEDAQGFVYESQGGVFLRGDTDDSGGLDLTDGIKILQFLFLGGPPARCADSMDANDTGAADLSDGVYIFNFLFLGGNQPPAPYPNAGQDPTDDNLAECTS